MTSNVPLQEDQASICEDVGREGALRDEVVRDDILGRIVLVLVAGEAV
jgi:hypothetical protein